MKCITNGKILLEDGVLQGKALLFDEQVLEFVDTVPEGAQVYDAKGGYVSPGLIDVHCHGFMRYDASNADVEQLRFMSEQVVHCGVTAWLPTTMTQSWPTLEACFTAIREVQGASALEPWQGAQVLGVHAEGPFINAKRKGAQAERWIQTPDADKLRPWADVVRLITVAPEVEGALEFIHEARAMGVTISMGHTDATVQEALAGIEAGATHVTHTFNAMPPLNHREPGLVGAVLTNDRVYCEMISDTFHVNPLLFGLMAKLKGDHLVLITDSIQVAGLPDGTYDMAGEMVIVDGIRCRFPNDTIAGSVLTLDRAVRNVRAYTGLPLWQVVRMASLNPANSIGVADRKGSLELGKDADILITDAEFNIQKTFARGKCVFCG